MRKIIFIGMVLLPLLLADTADGITLDEVKDKLLTDGTPSDKTLIVGLAVMYILIKTPLGNAILKRWF